MKIVDPTEKHPSTSQAVGRMSNVIYLLWAICGGFILHFLLSNFLTVLLRPDIPKPVETAEDVLQRGLVPYYHWEGEYLRDIFANFPDPKQRFQEIAEKLLIPDNWHQWAVLSGQMKYSYSISAWSGTNPITGKANDYSHLIPYDPTLPKSIIQTGPLTVQIANLPYEDTITDFQYYQRSSTPVPGPSPYKGHMANKKWPLKKVFFRN